MMQLGVCWRVWFEPGPVSMRNIPNCLVWRVNDAAFAFKTGFSARALIGLLGNDDFSFKVSPDGSAFYEAIRIDSINGQVELPQPTILPGLAAAPATPPTGKIAVYARNRAGAPWVDVMRPSGRDFPVSSRTSGSTGSRTGCRRSVPSLPPKACRSPRLARFPLPPSPPPTLPLLCGAGV